MIGYIYHITNNVNNKKYIGKTWDIKRRLTSHFSDLKANIHHSHKLQRAYNKYGEKAFTVSYEEKNVNNEEELGLLEIQEINKYDSYYNGYNETLGGEGHKLSISLEDSILVYQILQRYDGVGRQIAKYFNCDHSVITYIKNNTLYSKIEYDKRKMQDLIEKIGLSPNNLKDNYIPHNKKKLTKESCLEILSVILQKRGYDKTVCEIFDVNSKLTDRLKNGLIYKEYIKEYNSLSDEQKYNLLLNTMDKYNIEVRRAQRQRAGVKNALTQEQINYILDNKNIKTRVQIAKDLGITADRVGSVCLGKSYKDLIAIYYSSKT